MRQEQLSPIVYRTRLRLWTLLIGLLATALVRTVVSAEPDPTPVEFNIAGGDATTTLTEFSRQAKLQLLFDYNVVRGHATLPLNGVFTPGDALRRLLTGSDLTFDFVNERTLAVMRKKAAPEDPKVAAETNPTKRASRPVKNVRGDRGLQAGTEEVIRITGTYMRGEAPVGQEVIRASRDDIEATGAATPADFLRTLPQVFGGGPNQDTHIGQEASSNSGFGVGVNLRGMGARATLVLINGRRVAPSGTEGEFVDVENIPLGAVQRIDILPDSVSATYGADAVGGVVNFVLRDRFDGSETILRGGSGTGGDLQEYLFSQTLGKSWDGGHGLISFEFYDRGALPAADRAYAVSDLRRFGGSNFNTNLTNPGNIIDPLTGRTYAIPVGQNGTHLTAANLVAGTENLLNRYLGAEIIPTQERWTLYGTGTQGFGDTVSLFTDVLVGHRRATETHEGVGTDLTVTSANPFYVNPSGGTYPIDVGYNFGKDLGPLAVTTGIDTMNATAGLDIDAGAAWVVRAYGSYVREKQNQVTGGEINFSALAAALADPNPLTAFNPFGDGSNTNAATLAALRANYLFWLDSQLETGDITADGPIGVLPGGPLQLAVGADWRRQLFSTATVASTSLSSNNDLSRKILSGFGQVNVPIFTEQNAIPAMRILELSAAGRYENYTGYGSATTPKYSLVWSPLKGIALRGTWSRSVRPPTLVDLNANQSLIAIVPMADLKNPRGVTNALLWTGGNGSVQPEHAQSWTTGLDLAPDLLPGLTLGITYFKTTFKDRIQPTTYAPTILSDPIYTAIVTRNPSAAQISYICNHNLDLQGSPSQCMSTAVGAIVDLRTRNLGMLLTDGIDFNGNYQRSTSFGKLTFDLGGTWLRNFAEAQTPDAPLISLLNTQNEPINLRLRASTSLQYGGWGALVAANFANSYRDTASVPERRINSWTTIDLQLRYDLPDKPISWLKGLRIEFNARNLFNVDPPFLNNQAQYLGYDQENADPYGRLLSLQFRKLL